MKSNPRDGHALNNVMLSSAVAKKHLDTKLYLMKSGRDDSTLSVLRVALKLLQKDGAFLDLLRRQQEEEAGQTLKAGEISYDFPPPLAVHLLDLRTYALEAGGISARPTEIVRLSLTALTLDEHFLELYDQDKQGVRDAAARRRG